MADLSPDLDARRPDAPHRFIRPTMFARDRPALIDAAGTEHGYRALGTRVADATHRLGPERRLVQIAMRNDIEAITWYLGALAGGHVVALTSGADTAAANDARDRLVDTYLPDVVIDERDGQWHLDECHPTSAHDLHPDLAVLLSTSGSTGSTKVVRLSHQNLSANAAAIADYLGLTEHDRAITTLPLQYCYGLSVLHSHLLVGASIVLNDASVVDPCFWRAVDVTAPTTLAGVPHTFDLLDRVGFTHRSWPSLRVVTQAGGRLAPDAVRTLAQTGRAAGWDFHVMYGQTEATARMAHLPPALAVDHAGAVGVAIPGGKIEIDRTIAGDHPDDVGEVVYRGPNVMLGYAEGPDDLALGRTCDEVRTGDLGRWSDAGLLEIVGRRGDFVKVFGLRLDLGMVRRVVGETGIDTTVDGDDHGIVVAVHDGHADLDRIAGDLARRLDLPPLGVCAALVADPPRLENGKLDRIALRAEVRASTRPVAVDDDPVRTVFRQILGTDEVHDQDTFVSLGGDSLSYVETSIALESILGEVPADWHHRRIVDLVPSGRRRRRTAQIDTSAVIRAVAIVTIVGSHATVFHLLGGAHLLLAVAGFNFARFGIGAMRPWRPILRVVTPTVAWLATMAWIGRDVDLRHVLLVRSLDSAEGRWSYWFVEALIHVVVLATLALQIGAIGRFERRHPFALATIAVAATLAIRFDLIPLPSLPMHRARPYEVAWLFAVGWLIARADSPRRRLFATVLAVAGVHGFFASTSREVYVILGLVALTWAPTIRLPRIALPVIGPVASASLYIYLTHLEHYVWWRSISPPLALVMSIVVGVAVHRVIDDALPRVKQRFSSPDRS